MNKKFVYQVSNNKKVIANNFFFSDIKTTAICSVTLYHVLLSTFINTIAA